MAESEGIENTTEESPLDMLLPMERIMNEVHLGYKEG